MIHVEHVGALVTVQDLGRPGWGYLGVSRSGAADRAAMCRANRIVGNTEGAAGLEVLLGGLVVRAEGHLVVAVCGAESALRLDGRPVPRDAVLDLVPGARLEIGPASAGLRAYLAVRGGVEVPPVLGSRSRDTLAGLGPEPVRPGDDLPVGDARPPRVTGWPTVDVVPGPGPADPEADVRVAALAGPRADWLDDASRAAFWQVSWEVTPDGDRVGIRLAGPVLQRAAAFREAELPSEGLVRGAVQVPPSGRPVIFLVDHPVTGGYPVVAVVLDADVDRVAQLRPGQRLRFARAASPPGSGAAGRRPGRPDSTCLWWGW